MIYTTTGNLITEIAGYIGMIGTIDTPLIILGTTIVLIAGHLIDRELNKSLDQELQ